MANLIFGVDPSARRIAIVGAYEKLAPAIAISYDLYKPSESQTPESLKNALVSCYMLLDRIEPLIKEEDTLYVWIEDSLVGRGGVLPTLKQAYVSGIVRGVLADYGFQVRGINVSSWKAAVCGNGRASKEDVLVALEKRWPEIVEMVSHDKDLIDAAAIAYYGNSLFDQNGVFVEPTKLTKRRVQRYNNKQRGR